MKYYLAPMEGITGFVFRNAYHDYFSPMDKYFAPFISPNQNICFTPREYRDIRPENNRIPHVIPQILTNRAEDFIKASQELAEMGYEEVNLNLGCPSGTVTAKRKGAGFLTETGRLRAFFDRVFEKPVVRISVKTRLGMYSPDEFAELLAIFNEYPLEELIIHPRVGKEFYDGIPHRGVYLDAVGKSRNPLCYNGDLYRVQDVLRLANEWDEACAGADGDGMCGLQKADGLGMCGMGETDGQERCGLWEADGNRMRGGQKTAGQEIDGGAKKQRAVMLGRGILRDPWLAAKCRKAGQEPDAAAFSAVPACAGHILEFSDRLFSDYAQYMGERNAMFRMKELWLYLAESFAEADANRRKLKKAQSRAEFEKVLAGLSCVD